MDSTDSLNNVILREIDIEEIAEKIIEDIKAIDLDTNHKVEACKSRIKKIIYFYKKESTDEIVSVESFQDIPSMCLTTTRSVEVSVIGLYEKAKVDTAIIHLMDQGEAKEAQRFLKKSVIDDNLAVLRKQAQKEAKKINDCTKALEKTARESIANQLRNRQDVYELARDDQPFVETLMLFEETDARSKRMVETTKNNVRDNLNYLLKSPTGKKTEEEIESEKFLTEALSQIKLKLTGDFENQREVMDRAVDDMKSKVEGLFAFKNKD